jgi:site-specific DNA-cytosine methylase
MRHLDLFSGIGTWALASKEVWPDREMVGFCEIDPFCQAVLKKHFPNVPIYADIRTLAADTEHIGLAGTEEPRADSGAQPEGETGKELPIDEPSGTNCLRTEKLKRDTYGNATDTIRTNGRGEDNQDIDDKRRKSSSVGEEGLQPKDWISCSNYSKSSNLYGIDLLTASPPCQAASSAESEKERMTPGGSGQQLLTYLETSSPVGASLRTCLASLVSMGDWSSTRCALTWKLKATKSGRSYFQLQQSTPRTRGTASGLSAGESIATPTATDASDGIRKSTQQKEGSRHSVTLKDDIMRLPMTRTPSASDGVGGVKVGPKYESAKCPKLKLRDKVAMLPTPTLQESEHPQAQLTESGRRLTGNGNSHSLNLADNVAMLGTPTTRDWKGARSREKMEEIGRNPATNSLCDQVETMLPTPEAKNSIGYQVSHGKKYLRLGTQIQMIPTPRTSSANGASQAKKDQGNPKRRLETEVALQTVQSGTGTGEMSPTKPAYRLRLSPAFGLFMMGLPMDYLNFPETDESVTRSSPTRSGGKKR